MSPVKAADLPVGTNFFVGEPGGFSATRPILL